MAQAGIRTKNSYPKGLYSLPKLIQMDIHHIWMVDDDSDDHLLFSTTLQEVNDSVNLTWFKTCNELMGALNSYNKIFPDLILLDMNLPGNNGLQCLQLIRQGDRLQDIPVIIFSTSSSPDVMKKAAEHGAFQYIIKPNSIEGFTKIIKEILVIPNKQVRK